MERHRSHAAQRIKHGAKPKPSRRSAYERRPEKSYLKCGGLLPPYPAISDSDSGGTAPEECRSCRYPATARRPVATSSSRHPNDRRRARDNRDGADLRSHTRQAPGSSGCSPLAAARSADVRAAAPVADHRPVQPAAAIRSHSGQGQTGKSVPGASLDLPVTAVDQ